MLCTLELRAEVSIATVVFLYDIAGAHVWNLKGSQGHRIPLTRHDQQIFFSWPTLIFRPHLSFFLTSFAVPSDDLFLSLDISSRFSFPLCTLFFSSLLLSFQYQRWNMLKLRCHWSKAVPGAKDNLNTLAERKPEFHWIEHAFAFATTYARTHPL